MRNMWTVEEVVPLPREGNTRVDYRSRFGGQRSRILPGLWSPSDLAFPVYLGLWDRFWKRHVHKWQLQATSPGAGPYSHELHICSCGEVQVRDLAGYLPPTPDQLKKQEDLAFGNFAAQDAALNWDSIVSEENERVLGERSKLLTSGKIRDYVRTISPTKIYLELAFFFALFVIFLNSWGASRDHESFGGFFASAPPYGRMDRLSWAILILWFLGLLVFVTALLCSLEARREPLAEFVPQPSYPQGVSYSSEFTYAAGQRFMHITRYGGKKEKLQSVTLPIVAYGEDNHQAKISSHLQRLDELQLQAHSRRDLALRSQPLPTFSELRHRLKSKADPTLG